MNKQKWYEVWGNGVYITHVENIEEIAKHTLDLKTKSDLFVKKEEKIYLEMKKGGIKFISKMMREEIQSIAIKAGSKYK